MAVTKATTTTVTKNKTKGTGTNNGFTKQFGSSSFIPEDKDQRIVRTPWGKGTTIRTRRGGEEETENQKQPIYHYDVELDDWGGQPQRSGKGGVSLPRMLYSATKYPSVTPQVGDDVKTLWGRGRLLEIRPSDGMFKVRLSSWRLADRSTVTCYVNADQIDVMRPLRIYDMNVFQKVEHAMDLKQDAARKFSSTKDYEGALELYSKAVDAVRYVQHGAESTNIVRADLLVLMITCSNNAGMCCLHLNDHQRAEKFAKNAVVLVEALHKKKESSKILQVLHRDGITDSQIFGTYRVKSKLIMATSMVKLHRPQEAIVLLKETQQIIATYKIDGDPFQKQLHVQEKELRKIYDEATKMIKADRQKEKKRAKAMFGGGGGDSGDATKEEEEKKDTVDIESSSISTATNDDIKTDDSKSSLSPPSSSSNSSSLKKRVSFADGTTPGNFDDNEVPGFFDEHKEALFVVAGIAVGWLAVRLLTSKKQ